MWSLSILLDNLKTKVVDFFNDIILNKIQMYRKHCNTVLTKVLLSLTQKIFLNQIKKRYNQSSTILGQYSTTIDM